MDENPLFLLRSSGRLGLVRPVSCHLAQVHLMRGLPEGHLPQRRKRWLLEKVFFGALRLFRRINHSAVEAVQQGARREVDENDLIGTL